MKRDTDALLYDLLILLGLLALGGLVLIGLVASAGESAPMCTPIVVTMYDYDHGTTQLDGCLGLRDGIVYAGAAGGLTVTMTSPNNIDGDGIYRSGFEELP